MLPYLRMQNCLPRDPDASGDAAAILIFQTEADFGSRVKA